MGKQILAFTKATVSAICVLNFWRRKMEQRMMTFFTMPQGEILNDGSVCGVVNIRVVWEKHFTSPQLVKFLAEIFL